MASSKNLFLLSRRAYTVAAENTKVKTMTSTIRKGSADSRKEIAAAEGQIKEVYWMRDPKTGYYVPESHFDQIDAAELREKLLFKKQ